MSCNCRRCRDESSREEVVTCPTETEVRTRTTERVVKHIHPKEIINVHRTIIRNEHCFPVHERDVFETVVEGESGCCGNNERHNRHNRHESHNRHDSCNCRRRNWGFW